MPASLANLKTIPKKPPAPRIAAHHPDKLRVLLLKKAEAYLNSTPISDLNPQMLKSISEVLRDQADPFTKAAATASVRAGHHKSGGSFEMPFPVGYRDCGGDGLPTNDGLTGADVLNGVAPPAPVNYLTIPAGTPRVGSTGIDPYAAPADHQLRLQYRK